MPLIDERDERVMQERKRWAAEMVQRQGLGLVLKDGSTSYGFNESPSWVGVAFTLGLQELYIL